MTYGKDINDRTLFRESLISGVTKDEDDGVTLLADWAE